MATFFVYNKDGSSVLGSANFSSDIEGFHLYSNLTDNYYTFEIVDLGGETHYIEFEIGNVTGFASTPNQTVSNFIASSTGNYYEVNSNTFVCYAVTEEQEPVVTSTFTVYNNDGSSILGTITFNGSIDNFWLYKDLGGVPNYTFEITDSDGETHYIEFATGNIIGFSSLPSQTVSIYISSSSGNCYEVRSNTFECYAVIEEPEPVIRGKFILYNRDGTSELANIDCESIIDSINLYQSNEGLITFEIVDTLGSTYYFEYTPYICVGFSKNRNSNKADYYPDVDGITYNIGASRVVWYELNYTDNSINDNTVNITLYHNSSEPNRVDKTNYLSTYLQLNGTFRDSVDIVNPVFTIDLKNLVASAPNFNYVYIPKFNRYYYVNNLVNIVNNVWEVNCSCDVLMSYKDTIKQQDAIISRQEKFYDPRLIDGGIFTYKQCYYDTIEGEGSLLFNNMEDYTYILVASARGDEV